MNRDLRGLSIVQGFVKDMKNVRNASNASRSFGGKGAGVAGNVFSLAGYSPESTSGELPRTFSAIAGSVIFGTVPFSCAII